MVHKIRNDLEPHYQLHKICTKLLREVGKYLNSFVWEKALLTSGLLEEKVHERYPSQSSMSLWGRMESQSYSASRCRVLAVSHCQKKTYSLHEVPVMGDLFPASLGQLMGPLPKSATPKASIPSSRDMAGVSDVSR